MQQTTSLIRITIRTGLALSDPVAASGSAPCTTGNAADDSNATTNKGGGLCTSEFAPMVATLM
jgi:hypothetical protein